MSKTIANQPSISSQIDLALLLQDEDMDIRQRALAAVELYTPNEDTESIAQAYYALRARNLDPEMRNHLSRLLITMGNDKTLPEPDALIAAASDPYPPLAVFARNALLNHYQSIPPLLVNDFAGLFDHADLELRRLGVELLKDRIGNDLEAESFAALTRRLHIETDDDLRATCAHLLLEHVSTPFRQPDHSDGTPTLYGLTAEAIFAPALRDPLVTVRQNALAALVKLYAHDPPLALLEPLTRDPAAEIAISALDDLTRKPEAVALPLITRALEHPDPVVRAHAVIGLAQFHAPTSAFFVPLGDADPNVRACAVQCLKTRTALIPLDSLSEPDSDAKIDPQVLHQAVVGVLIEQLTDPHPQVAQLALEALRTCEPSAKIAAALLTFSPENGKNRADATDLLAGYLPDPAVVAELRQRLERDPDPRVRKAAVRAFAGFDEQTYADLRPALSDPDRDVYADAVEALAQYPAVSSVPPEVWIEVIAAEPTNDLRPLSSIAEQALAQQSDAVYFGAFTALYGAFSLAWSDRKRTAETNEFSLRVIQRAKTIPGGLSLLHFNGHEAPAVTEALITDLIQAADRLDDQTWRAIENSLFSLEDRQLMRVMQRIARVPQAAPLLVSILNANPSRNAAVVALAQRLLGERGEFHLLFDTSSAPFSQNDSIESVTTSLLFYHLPLSTEGQAYVAGVGIQELSSGSGWWLILLAIHDLWFNQSATWIDQIVLDETNTARWGYWLKLFAFVRQPTEDKWITALTAAQHSLSIHFPTHTPVFRPAEDLETLLYKPIQQVLEAIKAQRSLNEMIDRNADESDELTRGALAAVTLVARGDPEGGRALVALSRRVAERAPDEEQLNNRFWLMFVLRGLLRPQVAPEIQALIDEFEHETRALLINPPEQQNDPGIVVNLCLWLWIEYSKEQAQTAMFAYLQTHPQIPIHARADFAAFLARSAEPVALDFLDKILSQSWEMDKPQAYASQGARFSKALEQTVIAALAFPSEQTCLLLLKVLPEAAAAFGVLDWWLDHADRLSNEAVTGLYALASNQRTLVGALCAQVLLWAGRLDKPVEMVMMLLNDTRLPLSPLLDALRIFLERLGKNDADKLTLPPLADARRFRLLELANTAANPDDYLTWLAIPALLALHDERALPYCEALLASRDPFIRPYLLAMLRQSPLPGAQALYTDVRERESRWLLPADLPEVPAFALPVEAFRPPNSDPRLTQPPPDAPYQPLEVLADE
jgi:HEAT repeat protein